MTLLQPLFSVGPRSRASAVLLAAGLVMATAATTLVAAVPLYADAISEAGFRRTLVEAGPDERGIEARVRAEPSEWDSINATIDGLLDRRLPGELRTLSIAETGSFGLPDGAYADGVITSVGSLVTDEDLLDVVEGSLDAAATDGAVAAWLTVGAAAELGLGVGDRIELDGRASGPLLAELTALVEIADRFDELWFDQPDIRDAVTVTGNFRDTGPFLVDPADFARIDRTATVSWRGVVDPATITTSDIGDLRAGARNLTVVLEDRLERDGLEVDSRLSSLLADIDTALGSTSAVIAVILLQLVGLALYGLALAAAVLAGSRLVETSLLRSRGATAAQMGVLAATEALLIAVPAAVLGPVIGGAVVGLLERFGPVAASGLDLTATVTRPAVVASVVVAVVAVGVITWPAVRSAQALSEAKVERVRPSGPGVLQRTGADVVIAVLALLALWQLTQSSAATEDLSGRLGTDPVLVFAPTLGVIAASLITLRVIALGAQLAGSRAASGSGLATALAGWELSRRPGRTVRTAVLVVLSVTVGTFAAVQGSSWERSQRDQADAAVSADALVEVDARPAALIGPMFHASAFGQTDGVTATVPVDRPVVNITAELGGFTAVATDTRQVDDVLRLRSDLRDDSIDLAVLHDPVDLGAITLGEPTADLTVAYSMERSGAETDGQVQVAILIIDRFGTIHRLESDPVPVTEPDATLTFPLTSSAVPGFDLRLAGPIELLQVQVVAPIVLDERFVNVARRPAVFDVLLDDFAIGSTPVQLAEQEWFTAPIPLNANTIIGPNVAAVAEDGGLRLTLDTGLSEQRAARTTAVFDTSNARASTTPREIPALATSGVLDALELSVGRSAVARVGGTTMEVRFVGVVPAVPFDVGDDISMLIDWPTYVTSRFAASERYEAPVEWALGVSAASAANLDRVFAAEPFSSVEYADRRDLARELADDPFAVGLFGSLALALVASLLVAVVGLMLTAVVGARERRASYSVLRAMGAPTRVLRRWLLLEIVPLVGLSAAAGLTAGVLLARIALESLTVTTDGTRAVPAPTLVIPWGTVGAIVAVALAAGIALPLVTGRLLGRNSTADDLRIGEAT